MKLQHKQRPRVLHKIATFEESIEASKVISRAIAEGVLDDAGELAEITPEELILSEDGTILGVVVTIRASAQMAEGVFQSGHFTREITSEGSNVSVLRSVTRGRRRSSEMIETRIEIPA